MSGGFGFAPAPAGPALAALDAAKARKSSYDVRDFGAAWDARAVLDATMDAGSAVLTSASGLFTPDVVGKYVAVQGAGAAGTPLVTTIADYTSPTQVTLAAAAVTAIAPGASGKLAVWGTDDSDAVAEARGEASADIATLWGGAAVEFPAGAGIVDALASVEGVAYIGQGDGITTVMQRAGAAGPLLTMGGPDQRAFGFGRAQLNGCRRVQTDPACDGVLLTPFGPPAWGTNPAVLGHVAGVQRAWLTDFSVFECRGDGIRETDAVSGYHLAGFHVGGVDGHGINQPANNYDTEYSDFVVGATGKRGIRAYGITTRFTGFKQYAASNLEAGPALECGGSGLQFANFELEENPYVALAVPGSKNVFVGGRIFGCAGIPVEVTGDHNDVQVTHDDGLGYVAPANGGLVSVSGHSNHVRMKSDAAGPKAVRWIAPHNVVEVNQGRGRRAVVDSGPAPAPLVGALLSFSAVAADTAAGLPAAETGQAWTAVSGVAGINGNRVYSVSGGPGPIDYLQTIDTGTAFGAIRVSFLLQGNTPQVQIHFNRIDAANYMVLLATKVALTLYKVVAGVATQLGTVAFTDLRDGWHVLTILRRGTAAAPRRRFFLDGTLLAALSHNAVAGPEAGTIFGIDWSVFPEGDTGGAGGSLFGPVVVTP